MTRQEWFDNQTPEVQEQFKMNCNTLNEDPAFEWWINQSTELTSGIGGAFVWADSNQGHEYWSKINAKYSQN